MPVLLDEEKFIEQNILKADERVSSPLSRFLDRTPTFVTYYHINHQETTSDEGFHDIESVLGVKSPLRFQKITNFPLYGIESIIPDLQEGDAGLDVNYEGEAIILPNTLKPLPNDFFTIPYLHDDFIFRITGIDYDTIRPDNFYKVAFKLSAIDAEKRQNLDNQVHEKFTCLLENIGTENQCLIQEDYKEQIDKIDTMYNDMVSLYLKLFYNQRYNVLLGEMGNGKYLYDPFMCMFINQNSLFKRKGEFTTIYLEGDHIIDNKRSLKYERSVYRFIERRDVKLIAPFFYDSFAGSSKTESGFYKWMDDSVQVVDLPSVINEPTGRIFSDRTIETIRLNGPAGTKYLELLKNYIRGDAISVYDIPLTLNDELIRLDANLEMFFITPILLYIVRDVVQNFMKTGMDTEGAASSEECKCEA